MRLAAPRSDARAGGTRARVCLSEQKLSSGALLGEARVNKAVEFLQRKTMNYGPRTRFNEAPGSARRASVAETALAFQIKRVVFQFGALWKSDEH